MKSSSQDFSHTGKVIVADTGAIIAGLPLRLPLPHFSPPSVVEEVRDLESKNILEESLNLGRLKVVKPSNEYIKKAIGLATKSGTFKKLSSTDIELIALALYLKTEQNVEVVVATDDYSIQYTLLKSDLNIKILRIRYRGVRI